MVLLQPPGKTSTSKDFPGDPVVKNLSANAGDTGWIPGLRKISHAVGQLSPQPPQLLSPRAVTTETRVPSLCSVARGATTVRSSHTTTREEPSHSNKDPAQPKIRNLNLQVQFSCSVMSDSVTPWTAARQASLSITSSWSLPKIMSTELVMPSNHLILCRPLLLLPTIPPSIRVFSK